MKNRKSVTHKQKNVTSKRDALRARTPSYGGDVTLSRVTQKRDVTDRKRDSTALRPTRHEAAPSIAKKPMTWVHIAALNLIADSEAGIEVRPARLAAARSLMGAAS